MSGHGGITAYLSGAPNTANNGVNQKAAHYSYRCPHCEEAVSGAVIAQVNQSTEPSVSWLRCTACGKGAVLQDDAVQPSGKAGEAVEGLPPEVQSAYDEARASASAGAYTACELMCRKILMHVAVDKGAKEGEPFASYVDYLIAQGYLTPPMKPWADLIQQHANIATHKIPPSDKNRAFGTLSFTAQLLRLVYEMDHKVAQFMTPPTPGQI